MIRPAKSADAFALVDIIKERHVDTRYYGHVGIDDLEARRMFAQAAQRHGGTNEGASFLMVHDKDGEPDAFMLGVLNRIYVIGDKLGATDVFLLGRRGANPRALIEMFDAYVAWADANPKVFEIGASWADSIPGNEGIIDAYKRRGFTLRCQTFMRGAAHAEERKAA